MVTCRAGGAGPPRFPSTEQSFVSFRMSFPAVARLGIYVWSPEAGFRADVPGSAPRPNRHKAKPNDIPETADLEAHVGTHGFRKARQCSEVISAVTPRRAKSGM